MGDWIAALIYLIKDIGSFLAGAGVTWLTLRWEYKEKYKSMVFRKRLDAHQKAFEWCHILNRKLNSGNPDEIHDVANKFREWLDANCLYLDRKSPNIIIALINYAHQYAAGQVGSSVFVYLNKALKSIVEGIGAEYLPKELREAGTNVP